MERRQLSRTSYNVGWICALPDELTAATMMFEEEHQQPEGFRGSRNNYRFGSIGCHNVAITVLPIGIYGTTTAARVARNFQEDFPNIHYRLFTGIAGGMPTTENDVRLGDVVVSTPSTESTGVIQWDSRKILGDGQHTQIGILTKPPEAMLQAVGLIKALDPKEHGKGVLGALSKARILRTDKVFNRPPIGAADVLFLPTYKHISSREEATCEGICDRAYESIRPARDLDEQIKVHFGIIASGNSLVRDAVTRDEIQKETGALCFEMEASGIMDDWPCLVIRGICDYSDSHKNKIWQPYAACTAAGFAKFLLIELSGPSQAPGYTPHTAPIRNPHEDEMDTSDVYGAYPRVQQMPSYANAYEGYDDPPRYNRDYGYDSQQYPGRGPNYGQRPKAYRNQSERQDYNSEWSRPQPPPSSASEPSPEEILRKSGIFIQGGINTGGGKSFVGTTNITNHGPMNF